MDEGKDRYSTRLTLGDFRRMTAHLPDDAVFLERAHSEVRAVMLTDFKVDETAGDAADLETLEDMGATLEDLGLDGVDPGTPTVVLSAWD